MSALKVGAERHTTIEDDGPPDYEAACRAACVRIAELEARCERLATLLREGAAIVVVGDDATGWVEELRTEHVI